MRRLRSTLSLALLAAALFAGAAIGQESRNSASSDRRILDIGLLTFRDTYRIRIRLDRLGPFEVHAPSPGAPLRVTMLRARPGEGVLHKLLSNELIQGVRVATHQEGLTTLEFLLRTSQVEVAHHTLPSQNLLVIDLKLRRGVKIPAPRATALPSATPHDAASAPRPTPSPPQAAPSPEPTAPLLSLPPLAEQTTPTTGLLALPDPVAGPAIAQIEPDQTLEHGLDAVPSGEEDSPESLGVFPAHLARLDIVGGGDITEAFSNGQFGKAIQLGIDALGAPQTPRSLESLLYLLAECRYRRALVRESMGSSDPTAWSDALNYYRQAIREVPDTLFRPHADYRVAQILGHLKNIEEQIAALQTILDKVGPSAFPHLHKDIGQKTFGLYRLSGPGTGDAAAQHLREARKEFQAYVDLAPDSPGAVEANFLLGETYYYEAEQAELASEKTALHTQAYNAMHQALRLAATHAEPLIISLDQLAHYALAGHGAKAIDLAFPFKNSNPQQVQQRRDELENSRNGALRLRLARLLAEADNRDAAMAHYDAIINDPEIDAADHEIETARLTLVDYGFSDRRSGRFNASLPYDAYARPMETLEAMYESSQDLTRRAHILQQRVRYLIGLGQGDKAFWLVLPHLPFGRLPAQMAEGLRREVQDLLPAVLRELHEAGELLVAIYVYESFADNLESHPRRVDILLRGADLMIGAGLPERAADTLNAVRESVGYGRLEVPQRAILTSLERELLLQSYTEEAQFERAAEALARDGVHPPTRRRVLGLLARFHSRKNDNARAAEAYLAAARLPQVASWPRRLHLYHLAGIEWESAGNHLRALETFEEAVRGFDVANTAADPAPDSLGNVLLGLARNAYRNGRHVQAVAACRRHRATFAESETDPTVSYLLSTAYELEGRPKEALDQYKSMAAQTQSEPFWGGVGAALADHLTWEAARPYLRGKGGKP